MSSAHLKIGEFLLKWRLMSGHSHWETIKRQKETNDQKRGKIFSKLGKAISIAARNGVDLETNFKLRLAVEKAKQASMPKENILRAIEKGSGKAEAIKLEEIVYEGYGPEGIAIMVEAVTDNRNRTTAEIKNIFERGGGSLASPGAVSFQFKKAGFVAIKKKKKVDEQILKLIDLGVEEVEETPSSIEIYIQPDQLNEVKNKIEQAGFQVLTAELTMKPKTEVKISDPAKQTKVLKLIKSLKEDEDIQKVYANLA